ncbi:MAG: Leader peptidase (Prepilin peptidase) / N-methyltransferase [uncultured Frankineae bacterium]|uniref:Prepilin leader peptidase/N-methyltransferase n=1 Tax=uncultured Frankineae bacterium TaxID=437475 RepID=A0A6J4MMT9_9ACTN|nr:MAG: Leader peptidase (Prepilin peptidase) / N-methyltransferase [uncultured Frankineae bacterium]
MAAAVVVACAVLGLLIGSFLNVVIWRVPRGQSVVRPASACPSCGAMLHPRDNVPVVSWLLLRGRCRHCSDRVSARYPLVELATAGLFAVMALRFGLDPVLPAYLYLAAVGLALAVIDLDCKRLPNALTLPSYPVAAALLALATLLGSDSGGLVRALLGGAAMYVVYFVLCFAYPAGMGFGDVKLAGVLGMYTAWLGWGAWAVGLFLGFLLGGLFGVLLILARRGGRKTAVPFGPFMLVGVLIAVLVGQDLARAYLASTGV